MMSTSLLKTILFVLVFCLIVSEMVFAEIFSTDFVGAWPFDEGVGKKAVDISGKSGDATIQGTPKWVVGKFGSAVKFDGKSDYIEIKLPDIFNGIPKNDFTMAFWTNIQDISGSGTIWTRLMEARYDDLNYIQFVIQINDGELGVNLVSDGVENTFIVNSPIKADTWYHVTATWIASKKTLGFYLNGVLQTGVGTAPASPGTQKILNIARRSDGNTDTYFDGIVDEFAIFNRALTEEEIKTLMSKGLRTLASVSSSGKLINIWGKIKSSVLFTGNTH